MEVSPPERPYLELARQVLSLARTVRRHTDPLLRQHHDVSGHELFALRAVAEGESNPMRLAERLDLPPSSASRLLDRLVEIGLLARSGDPDDRRKTRLTMTAAGRETAERARQHLDESLSTMFSNLPLTKVVEATELIAGLSLEFGSVTPTPASRHVAVVSQDR